MTTTTARPTAFVTGASGFIGAELVKNLVDRGHRVVGLTRSHEAALRVRRAGAIAVVGDLLEAGRWQDEAAAEWVFHLPPQLFSGRRVSRRSAASISRARVSMDRQLLDAVAPGPTRRIVYLAEASYYGAAGRSPITEDAPPRPSAWGRHLSPALERVEGYVIAGLPIVTALPGWVYGNGSWCRERVIEPILANRRVLQFGKPERWVSPIHVQDCARALIHLAERGAVGGRYFLVNDDPVRLSDFASTVSCLANRRLRVFRLPAPILRLLAGNLLHDYLRAEAVFSNVRLRGLGFRFLYPTLAQGLPEVIRAHLEQ
jgi:nucleoside-diphosphate-sugar epimerase